MPKSKFKHVAGALGVIIIYMAVKLYVSSTPTDQDDHVPDLILKWIAI